MDNWKPILKPICVCEGRRLSNWIVVNWKWRRNDNKWRRTSGQRLDRNSGYDWTVKKYGQTDQYRTRLKLDQWQWNWNCVDVKAWPMRPKRIIEMTQLTQPIVVNDEGDQWRWPVDNGWMMTKRCVTARRRTASSRENINDVFRRNDQCND